MSDKENNNGRFFREMTWGHRLIMYASVVLLAVVYIVIFSDGNYWQHKKLNTKIAESEQELKKQGKNVKSQSTYKDIRQDSQVLERYRREQLNMKKENEDLFIVKQ